MNEEVSISQDLRDSLDKMFKKMTGSGKLQTIERQKALMRFTDSFAEKQNTFKKIFEKDTTIPPELQKKTAKNIDEANQQFIPLVAFINEKEKEIDDSSSNLVQFNKEMNIAISTFINNQN